MSSSSRFALTAVCTMICFCLLSDASRFAEDLVQMNEIYGDEMTVVQLDGAMCGRNKCLTVGMDRYSIPRCQPLGRLGEFCRADNEAENKTLYYPNQDVECKSIYTLFCPCAEGLQCTRNTCQ